MRAPLDDVSDPCETATLAILGHPQGGRRVARRVRGGKEVSAEQGAESGGGTVGVVILGRCEFLYVRLSALHIFSVALAIAVC